MKIKSLVSLTISKIIQTSFKCDCIRNCRSSLVMVVPLEVKEALYEQLLADDTFKTCVDYILNFGKNGNFSVVKIFFKFNIPCLLSLPDTYLFKIWQHFIIQDFEEGFCQYWDDKFGPFNYDEGVWERYERSEIILQFMKEKIKSRIFDEAQRDLRRRFENYFESNSDDSDVTNEMQNLQLVWATQQRNYQIHLFYVWLRQPVHHQ